MFAYWNVSISTCLHVHTSSYLHTGYAFLQSDIYIFISTFINIYMLGCLYVDVSKSLGGKGVHISVVHASVSPLLFVSSYLSTRPHISTVTYQHVYIYVCTHTCLSIYLHVSVSPCVQVCMSTDLHAYNDSS
jgi:hypothetical protein